MEYAEWIHLILMCMQKVTNEREEVAIQRFISRDGFNKYDFFLVLNMIKTCPKISMQKHEIKEMVKFFEKKFDLDLSRFYS